jgi:nitrogen-specific signal transduction histidine kinase
MQDDLINELRQEIESPLAALRQTLNAIAVRCDDFHVLDLVRLAEAEADAIAAALDRASDAKDANSA